METTGPMTLFDVLMGIADPRADRVVMYPLPEILFVVLCGVLGGATTYKQMVILGEERLELYRHYFAFGNGIPKAGTVGTVMSMIDAERLHLLFAQWMENSMREIGAESTADAIRELILDGKELRGSRDANRKCTHIVSALEATCQLVAGQVACDKKSNEITAIPVLLDMLNIEGRLVSIDAIGTQHEIVKAVLAKNADYFLEAKKNQKYLMLELQDFFAPCIENGYRPTGGDFAMTYDCAHGRSEKRRAWVAYDIEEFEQCKTWEGIAGAAAIQTITERKMKNGRTKVTTETHYYIFSRRGLTAEDILHVRRTHWAIENGLHWVLDVGFDEDHCRARAGDAAQNLNALREMARNVMAAIDFGEKGTRNKMMRFAHSTEVFHQVLAEMGFIASP